MSEVKATGVIKQVFDKVNTKSNESTFQTCQVQITSNVGKGLIVLANRTTLNKDKEVRSLPAVGDIVTLHGRTFTNAEGKTEMRFDIQSGVAATTGNDLLKAFGLKQELEVKAS